MIANSLRIFGLIGAMLFSGCAMDDEPPKKQSLNYFSGLPAGTDVLPTTSQNPFDPIALNNSAVAELNKGRYEQALTLLRRANRLAPANAEIAANLSNLERWMSIAEGQLALGLAPPKPPAPAESAEVEVPALPPLWQAPAPKPTVVEKPAPQQPGKKSLLPQVGADGVRAKTLRGI